MLHRFRAGISLVLVGIAVGCGGGASKEVIPALVPVSGKVLLDGKPDAGIAVTFVPMDKGNPSSGVTNAEGAYSLTYRNGDPGVPAGNYVVMFSKLTQKDGSPIPPDKTAADVMAVDKIPERYRVMDNPRYSVKVPEGKFDFEIKSK